MKTIFKITKYKLNFLGTRYYSKIPNNMKQLKNGEFAKTFEPDEFKKLSSVITKLGGKVTNSATDYIDTHLFDYELGENKVTIFINEPWEMTVSSHNTKLIEEITNLMGDRNDTEDNNK